MNPRALVNCIDYKNSEFIALYDQCYDGTHLWSFGSSNSLLPQDLAEEGGTSVTGGQTVLNPWLTIGGVATTVCQPNEFIM